MKSFLIQLLILPRGLSLLGLLCGVSLLLLSLPAKSLAEADGDQFPDQRQGGGTHWTVPADTDY